MATRSTTTLQLPVSERDHALGPEDAPVTLVEYGDYECPYCGRAEFAVDYLREHTGNQLRFIYRHFPNRTIHPHAMLAAEAAEAAGAQGKFWEMHSLLFDHQEELTEHDLFEYAAQLELDMDQFRHEMEEHVYASKVREDFRSGVRSGVRGTPTWFINGVRYDGAWDSESLVEAVRKPLGVKVRELTQEFTRLAASGGLMLLLFTVIAMFWANSAAGHGYLELWESHLEVTLGNLGLGEALLEWVNEGLMAIFFFVLGLEIKREITTGELASPKRAALPLAAAVGGMVVPAAFYVAVNAGDPQTLRGWGVPMATDIAFTLGVLTIMGGRIPPSLKVFFTALAIADDLGGIMVIALFYTSTIVWTNLIVAAGLLLTLIILNRSRVYSPLPYAIVGLGLWLAFAGSGIHPTIAGVLTAATIPTRSPPDVRRLIAQTDTVLNRYNYDLEGQNSSDQDLVRTLQMILDRMEPPAQRLEHALQPWTTYLILPIFALANAGIALGSVGAEAILQPVSLGIILGLVFGKPLGISFFAWVATRLGWAEIPGDVSWPQLVSASFLAGIGFTMAFFIAQAAFLDPAVLSSAKLGILVASVLAAALGWTLLNWTSPRYDQVSQAARAAPSAA